MKINITFDVYGTLIDTQGVLDLLTDLVGNQAQIFSDTWRSKQLEYSFRRGLMQRYVHFSVCTKDALNFTCDSLKVSLTETQKQQLLDSYSFLPAFSDVETALPKLAQKYRLIAFSNGESNSVHGLLNNANISDYFSEVVTADEIKTFKPNPAIYQHLLDRIDAKSECTWLISSNPFDVIGAKSHGLKAAWVKRSKSAVFDPWGIEPDVEINHLDELMGRLDLSD
ncbi:haloacid dehalogenase type II [Aliiglaciecola sp. 2_MG-2023]|uniref:haloacid dehalogenase type II n=1 Tax=unclassified Aliiglaciecola TaxID=2593648 RepID=UPI0026E2D2C6|nr:MULTISPECIES: haloacid dehalogenase type II [unclassified Aliiglaciecola]MDO6710874.1 haloacid dehalogenase type II [Aliiglaciecola sp. 2_MG-2023]MDO6752355.1 haloacid dehalogenase type II [Aliiglaciecola sp. 1_MG-2023]